MIATLSLFSAALLIPQGSVDAVALDPTLYEDVSLTREMVLGLDREPGEPYFIRVEGGAYDNTGNLYVLDSDEARVLKIGPTGAVLRSIGRKGDGPGEFRNPRNVFYTHAGLAVFDQMHARLTFFSGDRPDSTVTFITPYHAVENSVFSGRLLPVAPLGAGGGVLAQVSAPTQLLASRVIDSLPIVRATEWGTVIDTVLQLPVPDIYETILDRINIVQPFLPRPLAEVNSTGTVLYAVLQDVGTSGRGHLTLQIVNLVDGQVLERSYSTQAPRMRKSLADSLVDLWTARISRGTQTGKSRSVRRELETRLDIPDFLPPLGGLVIARNGAGLLHLTDPSGSIWWFLDPHGMPVGWARPGRAVRPLAMEDGTVWVVETGPNDEQLLVRMGLSSIPKL